MCFFSVALVNFFIFLSGALLALAFSPTNFYPLAIICPAILLASWLKCTAKQAFLKGLLFGLGFFGVGVSWVFISIYIFGHVAIPIALSITVLFIFVLSLFIATQGYVVAKFWPHYDAIKLFIAFPCSWTLFEWIRTWILTGFPWLLLGTSQTHLPLSGFIPVIGNLGVTFLVVFSSALLLHAVQQFIKYRFQEAALFIFILVFIGCVGYSLSTVTWTKPVGHPVKISLIQGNIPQQLKWDREYLNMSLNRYDQLTQQHWSSTVIIWPEAAIPALPQEVPTFLNRLQKEAKQHHVTIITGIPLENGFKHYNGMIVIGHNHSIYYKRRLVIFGEYVPWWINGLHDAIRFLQIPVYGGMSPGNYHQSYFSIDELKIAPFICYEIAYPDLVLESTRSNILLTINNDAWFGDSFALAQHLQIGQFQALATERYLLFLSNTGITAIVTPQGKINNSIQKFKVGVLTDNVQAMCGLTPWMRYGNRPIICLLFGGIIMAFILRHRYHR